MNFEHLKKIEKLDAKQITKPIQLVAFLLVSIIIIIPMFLYTATQITTPEWIPPLLVISSIIIVLIFFILVFIFQTKFRTQMLEDDRYSNYLNNQLKNSDNFKKLSYIEKMNNQHMEIINNLEDNNAVLFKSEDDFYSKVFFFLKKTENIIEAVDFITPDQWLNNTVIKRYLEVQKLLGKATKRRIHIYNHEQLNDLECIERYYQYIKIMEDAGFELYFFDRNDFNKMDFDLFGSMNIDNTCVIINESPEKGVNIGLISFSKNTIDNYQNRFERLLTDSIECNNFKEHLTKLRSEQGYTCN